MALTQEQRDALAVVEALVKSHHNPMVAMAGEMFLEQLKDQFMSARDKLEEIGEELKAHDHEEGCTCVERHQFMMDVLTHLEEQQFNDEVIAENLNTAAHAWVAFEEKFERAPTVTYIESQYTIPTGVAGVFFIHPAAQK